MIKYLLIALLIIAVIVGGWVGFIYLFMPEFSRGWLYFIIFLAVFAFGQITAENWNSTGDKVAKLKCLACVIIPKTIFLTIGAVIIFPGFIGIVWIVGGVIKLIAYSLFRLIGEVIRGILGF